MKKLFKSILFLLAATALTLSCAKEVNDPSEEEVINGSEQASPAEEPVLGEKVSITVSMPDDLTKISFSQDDQDADGPIHVAWEDGDKIRIANQEDLTKFSDFEIESGVGEKTATFTGTIDFNGPYMISYGGDSDFVAEQNQSADGDTGHLKRILVLKNVNTYENVVFSSDWAAANGGGSFKENGVIRLRAKLPAGAAALVKSVTFEISSSTVHESIKVNIATPGDAGDDGIIVVYASLPGGALELPSDASLEVFFETSVHDYSRTLDSSDLQSMIFLPGKVNSFKLNCDTPGTNVEILDFAGGIGEEGDPWLIATPRQLQKVAPNMENGTTKYFKLIEDIDMDGEKWSELNPNDGNNSGYTRLINFDGNNKTISNLSSNFFYVFKGSIKNLTLSGSKAGTKRGIFAEYCQGTGHTITNVDIINGSMATTAANSGALIGRINSGSGTTVTITDCDVKNTTVSGAAQTGGLIGSADATVVVSNCTVAKDGDGTSSVTATGSNCGGLIGNTTGDVTITDCTVSGTNVSGTGVVGGVVGFANSLVTISGSKFTGGTVTASNRYVGGFLGSTKDVASVITNCQVEDATVKTTYTDDSRGGGFVGQLQVSCKVKGCTVGTSAKKVTVSTPNPAANKVLNTGGFVGVNYGTITKNGDVRSKTYAKITSGNTQGQPLDLGGFVGFGRGTIEYCDAVVDMTGLKGQYIGGFAGYVIQDGTKIDNCTVDGAVTGNNYTGGFAGYVDSGSPVISNCSASGSVTAQSGCGGFVGQTMTGVYTNCSSSTACSFSGSNNGGFAGQIWGGSFTGCSASGDVAATGGSTYGGFAGVITNDGATLTKCSATGNVSCSTGSYNGGFIGTINKGTITLSKCYASGNVTCNQTYVSAFIAIINQSSNIVNATIENCYATGNIINSNQIRGGLIGSVTAATSLTISNCYASGSVVGSFRLGGLIGDLRTSSPVVSKCVAWNSAVTASSHGQTNWSSGAVIGTAHPNAHVSDCYRNPAMSLTVYCPPPSADWDHPDIDGTTHPLWQNSQVAPFTWAESTATAISAGSNNVDAGRWAYHGKHVDSGTTLSQLASTTLGWDSEIWDFSGELPTLR